MSPLRSDAELAGLVDDFESGRQDPGSFDHGRHMAVAMHYLQRMGEGEAAERVREGLKGLLRHHGIDEAGIDSVYHETITRFWVGFLGHVMATEGGGDPLYLRVNRAVERYGSMAPILAHYSRERLFSDEARRGWLEPDLEPLPF